MNRYIIFADDDADDLELITGYFKQFDSETNVLEFRNGKEVFRFLEEFAVKAVLPLLVVLDVNMPKLNGRDTLIAIRNHPQLKSIPIIIYSTSAGKSEADESLCKRYSATWVSKPSEVSGVKKIAKVIADFCKEIKHQQ